MENSNIIPFPQPPRMLDIEPLIEAFKDQCDYAIKTPEGVWLYDRHGPMGFISVNRLSVIGLIEGLPLFT